MYRKPLIEDLALDMPGEQPSGTIVKFKISQ
jgi:hypothetical protein